MGNCQAIDLAAATVEYPGGRVERFFDLAVPAQRLMSDYPGHFVAMISTSIVQPPPTPPPPPPPPMPPAHHHHQFVHKPPSFKLLPADAPLRIGHRYRLISFEEVLTYFSQGGAHDNLSRPMNVNTLHTRRINNKEHLRPEKSNTTSSHVVKTGC